MFIGRKYELAALSNAFLARNANLSVVYGRRRVGKSSLVAEAARGHRFFSFEGLENQSSLAQKKIFAEQLNTYGINFSSSDSLSWYELLMRLGDLIDPKEVTVILIDELQWLANYRSELISTIKLVWDKVLSKHANFKLVLCGSVASFMVRKVIKSRALYGRSDLCIHLQPFRLGETREMFADKSLEEVVLAQLLVGGIPKYLSLLSDKSSVMLSLAFHCMGKHAYLLNEYEKVFVSHFGNNPDYENIVRLLNSKAHGASRKEICKELSLPNSGQLTEILQNLEFAGMVHTFVPFDKQANSKLKRYVLSDHFMKFYLTFLEPLKLKGQVERVDFLSQVFNTPKMSSFLGVCFELLCLSHQHEIATALGFSGVRYQAGPYFTRRARREASEVQLDLVFKREDRVFTVCEVKYRADVNGTAAAKQLSEAIAKIPELQSKTVQKVLITNESAAGTLEDGIHFSRLLTSKDLLVAPRTGTT